MNIEKVNNFTSSASLNGAIQAHQIRGKRHHMEHNISSGDRKRREPVTEKAHFYEIYSLVYSREYTNFYISYLYQSYLYKRIVTNRKNSVK